MRLRYTPTTVYAEPKEDLYASAIPTPDEPVRLSLDHVTVLSCMMIHDWAIPDLQEWTGIESNQIICILADLIDHDYAIVAQQTSQGMTYHYCAAK